MSHGLSYSKTKKGLVRRTINSIRTRLYESKVKKMDGQKGKEQEDDKVQTKKGRKKKKK